MRHNYVADIGDFYKYKLLRDICGRTKEGIKGKKLGVVWYLYTDKCKEGDGKFTEYLFDDNADEKRAEDPELFDALKAIIENDKRSIDSIRKSEILPFNTSYYETALTLSHLPKGTREAIELRLKHRQKWLEGALEATEGCEVVFFDPDNGLEIKSVAKHYDNAPKFTFYDELLPFWNRGQSLIIYQHINRTKSVEKQIAKRVEEL